MATQWATLPTPTPFWNGDTVPISDYVPASQTADWLNTNENTTGGKIVAMRLYLIGVPLVWNKTMFKQARLNLIRLPRRGHSSWPTRRPQGPRHHPVRHGKPGRLLRGLDVRHLPEAGADSLGTLKSAVAGNSSAQATLNTDLKDMYTMLQELIKKGYVSSSVSSLNLIQGWEFFPEKKVAMSLTTDGNAISWAKTLGDSNMESRHRRSERRHLGQTYDVTQSSDEFITSWSPDPKAAATFLAWLHQPANMNALYLQTVRSRQISSSIARITNPLAEQLYSLDTAVRPSGWRISFHRRSTQRRYPGWPADHLRLRQAWSGRGSRDQQITSGRPSSRGTGQLQKVGGGG